MMKSVWFIRWRIWSAVVVAVGGSIGMYLHPHWEHKVWYRTVEVLILKLAERRPENTTPSQWALCLHHTWNLHTNYGVYDKFDRNQRDIFVEEFRARLNGPVDLATIDWIWDQYRTHAQAESYQRYLPTTPAMLDEAGSNEHALDGWFQQLKARGPQPYGTNNRPAPQ